MIGSYVKIKDSFLEDSSFSNGTESYADFALSDSFSLDEMIDYLGLNLSETVVVGQSYFSNTSLEISASNESDIYHHEKETLYILGLFELTTRWGRRKEGRSEMLSAQLAVEHINKQNVLPSYVLQLLVNDTGCDSGIGIDRFFHALYSNKTILMLLGTSCSNVTESLAHVVPYWNVLQVSFGSKSPSLSDRNKFPLFFRTLAPDSSHNFAKISFIKYFGWKIVAAFIQSGDAYLLPLNKLVKELEQENISCESTITFSSENYKEQLKVLKDLDTRIIFGSFSEDLAPKIFCEVYHMGMYGTDYVWIVQDLQESRWWSSRTDKSSESCSADHLNAAVEGLILVADYDRVTQRQSSISGLSNNAFESQLNVSKDETSRYVRQAYDAVWAMVLTLREAHMRRWMNPLGDFHYGRSDMVCDFVETMATLRFVGLSGPVKFNGADRMGNSIFRQVQGGKTVDIAIFLSETNKLDFHCDTCKKIQWKDDQIPIAQRKLKILPIRIPFAIAYVVLSLSLLGILVCLIFLYFNLRFGDVKTVKLTSPKLNNVAVIGCVSVYMSVILLSIDMSTMNTDSLYTKICVARIYLLSAGFSLAFGSMFAKTYRVHRLFTNCGPTLVRDKLLKDKQLIALILIPLVIDAVILTLWVMIDPMQQQLHNLTTIISPADRGVVYQPQMKVCRSQNTSGWFIALYGYKGLILIMGVYKAWETRHIKVPALNDSHYIGVCVYSAVFSAIITVFAGLTTEYITVSYLATTVSILISTTVTLLLLFLPKLKSVLGHTDGEDLIMQSMGLKTEFNTRRFVNQDRKELIYRLEIQNKVYKCELEALDEEIARLEELLSLPEASTSSEHHSAKPYTILHEDRTQFLRISSQGTSGRASWPSTKKLTGRPLKECKSEDKIDGGSNSRINMFGKLKKLFRSIPSLVVTEYEGSEDEFTKASTSSRKQISNPEMGRDNPVSREIIRSKSDNAVNK